MIQKQIGNRLSLLLNLKPRTQREWGIELGVSQGSISKWTRGEDQPLYALEHIADYFNIPIEYFFTTDERAECILYGTPVRSEDKISDLEKKVEEYRDKADEIEAESHQKDIQIARMKSEIEHYRNQPVQVVNNDPPEWAVMREEMRKQMEASKAILDAAMKVMDSCGI